MHTGTGLQQLAELVHGGERVEESVVDEPVVVDESAERMRPMQIDLE